MIELKLRAIGNSVGVVLPKEVLAALKVESGDSLYVSETPGGITLTVSNPTIEEELELGRDFMKRYRETFKALAK